MEIINKVIGYKLTRVLLYLAITAIVVIGLVKTGVIDLEEDQTTKALIVAGFVNVIVVVLKQLAEEVLSMKSKK